MKNKKPFSRMFIIGLDLFPYQSLIAINKNPKEVQRLLAKYGKPLDDDHVALLEKKTMGTACYLFNDKYNTSLIFIKAPSTHRALTLFDHEKIHLLHHVLSGPVNMPLTDQTEEVYAYASEYLLDQFLKKLFPK